MKYEKKIHGIRELEFHSQFIEYYYLSDDGLQNPIHSMHPSYC